MKATTLVTPNFRQRDHYAECDGAEWSFITFHSPCPASVARNRAVRYDVKQVSYLTSFLSTRQPLLATLQHRSHHNSGHTRPIFLPLISSLAKSLLYSIAHAHFLSLSSPPSPRSAVSCSAAHPRFTISRFLTFT